MGRPRTLSTKGAIFLTLRNPWKEGKSGYSKVMAKKLVTSRLKTKVEFGYLFFKMYSNCAWLITLITAVMLRQEFLSFFLLFGYTMAIILTQILLIKNVRVSNVTILEYHMRRKWKSNRTKHLLSLHFPRPN